MNKKSPILRMCIVTRELHPKNEMFRVVSNKNGIYFDVNQNIEGRGVYIKKELKVIELAFKRNSLSRGLKRKVPEEIYIELIQALSRERK